MIVILEELVSAAETRILDALDGKLSVVVKKNSEGPATKAELDEIRLNSLGSLLSDFMDVMKTYALVKEEQPSAFSITELGLRCLAHTVDCDKYVEDLVAAHKRLQVLKPKLGVL